MNLQVTSVVSRLAYIPHPNLNEFLLDVFLPTKDDIRTLPNVLKKVSYAYIPFAKNAFVVVNNCIMYLELSSEK